MFLVTVYDNRIRNDRDASLVASKYFELMLECTGFLAQFPWHFQVVIDKLEKIENQPFSVTKIIYNGCIGTTRGGYVESRLNDH